VADYRVYFMDYAGRFCAVELVQAENDREAVEKAENIREGKPVEIWSAHRAVARIGFERQVR
jgi:hypothetical protein